MTNHWKDIKNADVVLVMGANPAENHPCGFKWALEARNTRRAQLVTIDPRFTRTSAVAAEHLQIRPGSDIALLGGLVRYILTNNLHHADYVRAHTNASFIIGERFSFEDGLFSGFDEATSQYDASTWEYDRAPDGYVRRDVTLEHPRSVFQLLKQHYDRYTPERVAQITGCSEEDFLRIAKIVCSTGTADRVGTIMYAVGWTMHTVGTQIIRTAAIVQLLLGNIGRPGGGINALRGHANVQGATDHAIVAGILPGYLRVPQPSQTSLASHLEASTPQPLVRDTANYWGNYPKFFVSQLKAWFGDRAQPDNEFGYHYLGKMEEDATWLSIWDQAHQGKLEGFIALGFNSLLAGPNVSRLLEAMAKLKWKYLVRGAVRGKNLLMTGPAGCGKTMAAKSLVNALDRPDFYFNLGATQDPRSTLIGNTHFEKSKGTYFSESLFVKAISTPDAVILLDELSRAHPDAWNILMTVLDEGQRYLRLDEADGNETVKVAEGVTFIATANIGNEYTSTRVMDKALMDRFITVEMDVLNESEENELLTYMFILIC